MHPQTYIFHWLVSFIKIQAKSLTGGGGAQDLPRGNRAYKIKFAEARSLEWMAPQVPRRAGGGGRARGESQVGHLAKPPRAGAPWATEESDPRHRGARGGGSLGRRPGCARRRRRCSGSFVLGPRPLRSRCTAAPAPLPPPGSSARPPGAPCRVSGYPAAPTPALLRSPRRPSPHALPLPHRGAGKPPAAPTCPPPPGRSAQRGKVSQPAAATAATATAQGVRLRERSA